MHMADEVSASELIEFVRKHDGRRVSPGMLQYYTERTYLQPRKLDPQAVPSRTKSGRMGRRPFVLYSSADVILVRWMARLADEGIALKKFEGALRALRQLLPAALEKPSDLQFFVMTKDRHIGVSHDGRQIQLTGEVGQVLLAFPMKMAEETVAGLSQRAAGA